MLKMYVHVCFCLVFCLGIGERLAAQEYPMLHYSIEEGLPSKKVYSAYRDSKGFMWFGTDKGVTRYNGVRFENFSTFDGLPDNEIFHFREDHYGRLWLGTYNGALCYYKDGVFHTAVNTPFLKTTEKLPHTFNIMVERDSSVSFNFYNPYPLLSIQGDKVHRYDFRKAIYDADSIYAYHLAYKRKTGPNRFEIVYVHGILQTDSANNILDTKTVMLENEIQYIPSQDTGYLRNIKYVLSCNLDTLWSLSTPELEQKAIYSYYSDGTNAFAGLSDGMVINDSLWILRTNGVSSIVQDAWGNYWIATLNNGIFFLEKNFLSSRKYSNVYSSDIKYSRVLKGGVFFATYNNSLYFLKNGVTSCIVDFTKIHENVYYKHALDGTHLIDIARNKALFFDKLHVFETDLTSRKTIVHSIGHDSFGRKDAFLSKNKLYIRSRVAVECFDYPLSWEKAPLWRRVYGADLTQRIFGMALAPDSSLWYSTVSKIYRIENEAAIHQTKFGGIVLKNFIFLDTLMIGYTHTNDLVVIDYLKNHPSIDTIKSQNCVWDKLCFLDRHHILISTNGLYRVFSVHTGSKTGRYEVFAINNPLLPREADVICSDTVSCYFFKNGSVSTFNIGNLLHTDDPPRLYFTGVSTNLKRYLPAISGTELSYNEARSLVISISRVVWNGRTITQQYSVSKDSSDTWLDFEGEKINLFNLGYGNYFIRVRAKTASSGYSVPQVYRLTIHRPFWATWWFMLAIAGCAIAIVVVVGRYRIRYLVLKKEKEHQNEMKFVKSEYKALNALMNPHFVFNTLNNVQGLVNRDDKLAANEYIRVFADLIRQNMHNLSKEMITLQKEIELVVNYLLLEKLRFKELLNYSLEIDDKLDLSEIFVPPLLVQPLVENSIKHGILPLESVEGTVVIRIYEQDTLIVIEVRDNGVGLAKARGERPGDTHESFAMDNIRKRIDQLAIILNKEITLNLDEEKLPGQDRQWTVVTISMPAF